MMKNTAKKIMAATAVAASLMVTPMASVTAFATQSLTVYPSDALTTDDTKGRLVIKEGSKEIIIDADRLKAVVDKLTNYVTALRKRMFQEVEKRALDADVPAYDWEESGSKVTLTITVPSTAKSINKANGGVHGTAANDKNYDGLENTTGDTTDTTTNTTSGSGTGTTGSGQGSGNGG